MDPGLRLGDRGALTLGAISAAVAWLVGVQPVAAGALGLVVLVVKLLVGRIGTTAEEAPGVSGASSVPGVSSETVGGGDGLVFCREGELWRIGSGAAVFSLRDAKGLRYLHFLLSHPGREFHALELAQQAERLGAVPRQREGGLPEGTFLAGDDSLPVLDERAKAEYRDLLRYLEAELEEARALNDEGRVYRTELDIEALKQEMRRATGLGGRDRRTGGQAERARINVTRAIHGAIDRIAEHDASLAHHLSSTIRTGKFCRYEPDPVRPPVWRL
jgi:hypothetical protein